MNFAFIPETGGPTLAMTPGMILLGLVTAAAVWDWRERRIPNLLTYPALVAGLFLAAWTGGSAGLRQAGLGLLIGAFPFLYLYVAGQMGGGDVKLMAGVGCLAQFPFVLDVLVYTLAAGVVVAACMLARHRRLGATLVRFPAYLLGRHRIDEEKSLMVPFAIAVAAGTGVAVLMSVCGLGIRGWETW